VTNVHSEFISIKTTDPSDCEVLSKSTVGSYRADFGHKSGSQIWTVIHIESKSLVPARHRSYQIWIQQEILEKSCRRI